jgi:hypothetical protein
LEHRKTEVPRSDLDGWRGDLHAVTRPVWLCDHQLDLVPGLMQRSERGHGEGGRAGEDNLQEG